MKNQLKNICALALAVGFLAGCETAPEVTTYRDPLTNQETDLLSENELVSGSTREVVWLNAARIPVNGVYKTYLELQYAANKEAGPLEIFPGRTLTILADGQELKFSGLGSLEKREKNNVIYETARYEAKQSDIEAIANAQKVTVLVQGKDALIERDFGPDNFARFKNFLGRISAPGQYKVNRDIKSL